MSVYLGQDPVGISYLTQANMYEDNRDIMSETLFSPWTRPEGWPDLDSLNLTMSGTESFIYMTFRTGHIDDVCSFGLTTKSGSATVELGTISEGVFTASITETCASNGTKTYWFTSDEGYSEGTIVIKVTGRLSKFYLADVTRSNSNGTLKYYMQPLLERIRYIPEMLYFYNGSSTANSGSGALTLERDVINNDTGTAMTNAANGWTWCYNLQSLDISGWETPNVTTLANTFQYCRKLEVLDVTGLTTAKVTNMANVFDGCFRLKTLDLRNWNTEKLTSTGLGYAFRNCYSLKTIQGLENFYTNNVTSLIALFYNNYSIEDLSGISQWNVGNVTNLSGTFYNCYRIKTLDLSSWNVNKVTTINTMFYFCRNLEHISFPVAKTGTLSGSQAQAFYGCYNLQEINLNWITPLTSSVTSIGQMFSQCRSLSEINIPEGWNITGCTASESCYRIFSDCYKLQKITGISNWNMSGYNYSLAYSFQYDMCLKELDIKNWAANPTSMYYAFNDCQSLKEIDLTGWGWNNMTGTGAAYMFNGCNSLREIKGITHLGDAGNITSLAYMFASCWSLRSIPSISSWDVAKVTTCTTMFQDCRSLQSLAIDGWTLTKCTTIANMFRYCYCMKSLELTNWSLPAINANPDYIFTDMYSLIQCSGLPLKHNHRYQNDLSLPEAQWIRIFTNLQSVSSKTLYISTANINRLTTTTKQIATNKGWTLAN